ncbi:WAP-type 'four-disulfide core [Ancylostoma caninum]|uniref:WAP-type 'four-disulfide core n=1 Tax=Ancylostoma caninum TaxID=29170 RepID=A0A368FTN5_ANCCA|nr:WAP-type 'four-disulfide core [Ancylostoma caninum]
MFPLRSFPIVAETPIQPVKDRSNRVRVASTRLEKNGLCPPAGDEKSCNTYTQCSHDADCRDVEKCCPNACGSVCVDPTKASNCVHFAVAVKKLPEQKLHNRYFPKCDENGKFAPIQCDQRQCWCVDVNYGSEIPGSAVAISMRRADMCRENLSKLWLSMGNNLVFVDRMVSVAHFL